MKFIRIFLLVLIIIGIGLLVTIKLWLLPFDIWLLNHSEIARNYVDVQNKTVVVATSTLKELLANISVSTTTKQSKKINQTSQISSSTVQIAEFTVVVSCKNFNPVSVDINRKGLKIQTLTLLASVTGVSKCLQAESQDINFDGSLDFMVLSATGSGGAFVSYWLFDPDIQQFRCPNSNNDCLLANPKFDPISKTVISSSATGVGTRVVDTYQVIDGKLVLTKHERIGY